MDPILCHLSGNPLIKTSSFRKDHTRWACFYRDEDDSFDSNDESEDLYIITIPKQKGIVHSYFATIRRNGKTYYLQSNREEMKTTLYKIRYDECDSGSTTEIPKFYNLKLKEPLAPQFDTIFNNVKLLITFS